MIRTAVPDYDTGTLEISGANFGSTPAVEICVVAGADGIGTCWNRATQTQK